MHRSAVQRARGCNDGTEDSMTTFCVTVWRFSTGVFHDDFYIYYIDPPPRIRTNISRFTKLYCIPGSGPVHVTRPRRTILTCRRTRARAHWSISVGRGTDSTVSADNSISSRGQVSKTAGRERAEVCHVQSLYARWVLCTHAAVIICSPP